MKKKGNLLYAAKEIEGNEYPMFFHSKLGRDQYLIVIDSVLRKDPIKKRFAIVSEKKFKKISVEHWLQEEPPLPYPSSGRQAN